jgi:hypothetical protein
VKRYILPFNVWDKRLDGIVRIIGKARKEGKKWGGEVEEKEMRRLVISGNHYIRQGYSGFKIKGIAKLWVDETGKDWILHLLIKPPPF